MSCQHPSCVRNPSLVSIDFWELMILPVLFKGDVQRFRISDFSTGSEYLAARPYNHFTEALRTFGICIADMLKKGFLSTDQAKTPPPPPTTKWIMHHNIGKGSIALPKRNSQFNSICLYTRTCIKLSRMIFRAKFFWGGKNMAVITQLSFWTRIKNQIKGWGSKSVMPEFY